MYRIQSSESEGIIQYARQEIESLNLTVHSVSGAINIKNQESQRKHQAKSLLIPNAFGILWQCKTNFGYKKENHWRIYTRRLIYKETYFALGTIDWKWESEKGEDSGTANQMKKIIFFHSTGCSFLFSFLGSST